MHYWSQLLAHTLVCTVWWATHNVEPNLKQKREINEDNFFFITNLLT